MYMCVCVCVCVSVCVKHHTRHPPPLSRVNPHSFTFYVQLAPALAPPLTPKDEKVVTSIWLIPLHRDTTIFRTLHFCSPCL